MCPWFSMKCMVHTLLLGTATRLVINIRFGLEEFIKVEAQAFEKEKSEQKK